MEKRIVFSFTFGIFFLIVSLAVTVSAEEGFSKGTVPAGDKGAPQDTVSSSAGLHQWSLDLGSGAETDPDILHPSVPIGLNRLFEWDYRVLIREDDIGVSARYRRPARIEQLTFNYKYRLDLPARFGLGHVRDEVYDWFNQTPDRDQRGFILGTAIVLNPFWGLTASHDELRFDAPVNHFIQQLTTLGFGWTPLGNNANKPWNYSINPSVSYERSHWFPPASLGEYEVFGWAIGPTFMYGLDEVDIPSVFGLKRRFRLDRFRTSLQVSDSEISDFTVSLTVNLTAYATRFIKFSAGAESISRPSRGKHDFLLKFGTSFRIGRSELPF